MTDLEAILADLEAVEHALTKRIPLVRVIIDEHGTEVGRVSRGSFCDDHFAGQPLILEEEH
jgi:hypothetical protein